MKVSKEQQSVIGIVFGLIMLSWLSRNYFTLFPAGIVSLSLFLPTLAKAVHVFWSNVSKILGWISSHIILFILFYFFLTPIALLKRLSDKKGSMKSFNRSQVSGFSKRDHIYSKDDFINPW